jgi:hypothetical protein
MRMSLLAMLREWKDQLSSFFPCFREGLPRLSSLRSFQLGGLPDILMASCCVENLRFMLSDVVLVGEC